MMLALVVYSIFWCQLTSISAKNLWIGFFVLCIAADLGAIFCTILYPGNALFQGIFTTTGIACIYNITGVLYFIGYLGLFGGLYFPMVLRMYRYTKEKLAVILCVGVLFYIVGSVEAMLYWIGMLSGLPLPTWWQILHSTEEYPIFIGDILLFGTFLVKRDYIYRLPFDVHLLLVVYRASGLPAYTTRFETHRPIQIDGTLLSGLLTAMNSLFQEVGRKEVTLKSVEGAGLHFLLQWGKDVVTLVVTDQITFYLQQAVKQFTQDFEACYTTEIKACTPDLNAYNDATKLIKPNFPFFTVMGEKTETTHF
jgi:hypothetical protein